VFASQASTGTGNTTTIAYLAVAFIFSPAVLFASRPLSYLSVGLAIGCSAVCLALAWTNWKKSSRKAQ
jgi:hypothetical protein